METQALNNKNIINELPILKGILIILWGFLAILIGANQPIFMIKTFGILNLISFVITMWFTYNHRHLKIAHQWLQLEGLVELIAGIVFVFFVPDMNTFMEYMGIGIMFIIMLQFIYGYLLVNTGKYNVTNIAMRVLTVIVGGILGVMIYTRMLSLDNAFIVMGLFSFVYGVVNIQFGLGMRNAILGKAV